MKNKKLFGALSLLFATGLILSACNINKKSETSSPAPSSSTQPSSSSSEAVKYTVTFVVNGTTVQTSEVEAGSVAQYTGETPTKAGDAQAFAYGFRGWDKDITQPITEDTTFTAVFAEYAETNLVDNFEGYADAGEVHDNGKWVPAKYNNTSTEWEDDQGGSIDISLNAVEGEKSILLQSWTNGVGYKFCKKITTNPFTQSSNALKFNLMASSANTLKVILVTEPIMYEGEEITPSATYTMNIQSSEYQEYTIPMDGDWYLWGDPQYGTIASAAEWTGIHQDDVVKKLKRIEFYLQAPSISNNAKQFSFLDNVRFATLENPAESQAEQNHDQYTRYTGTTASGHVMRIDLGANNSATARIIDIETPVNIEGQVSVDGNQMTFTSNTAGLLNYSGTLLNSNQKIKRSSSSSSNAELAAEVANMDLNAVQVLDNFESYSSSGTAYYQSHLSKGDGMRGAYFSEYNGGTGAHSWSGDGWCLMGGEGTQMNLKTDGGHTGSKYGSFKNSSSLKMRYMSWGLYDGSASQPGFRGSKFSFWAKTNNKVRSMMVYVFSQPHPTFENRANDSKSATFNHSAALATWTHYEINIDPNLTYYGFMIYLDTNNTGSDAFLYLDDVEVYTADPYAEYIPPEPLTLPVYATYQARALGGIAANLAITSGSAAVLNVPGFGTQVTATYALVDDQLTLTLQGGVTYVGTLSENTKTITYVSVTGSDGLLKTLLTNLSFTRIMVETAELYASDGKMYCQDYPNEADRAGARGNYFCEYKGGSGGTTDKTIGGSGWTLMGGGGTQLSLDTTNKVEGSKSLKLKASQNGNMRYWQWNLYKGSDQGGYTGFSKFGFYLQNQTAAAVTAHVYVYSQAQVTTATIEQNRVVKNIDITSSMGWTYYTIDLDPTKTYYGYAIEFDKMTSASQAFINFDAAMFYNPYEAPNNSFFVKEGLVLTGKINGAADATITFGANGTLVLNCAALSAQPVNGTYAMVMENTSQVIALNAAGTDIVASFTVNSSGGITVEFTEISGALQSQISSGLFTGSYLS